MHSAPSISDIRFTPARELDVACGLLGWVSFVVDGLQLDGVALRVTKSGRITLSYPSRRDNHGRQHPIVLPVDRRTQADIESQVLAALEAQGVAP